MKQEIKTLWTTALRSGEYQQGHSALRLRDTYCCLGVLCELGVAAGIVTRTLLESGEYGYGWTRERCYLPREVREWAEIEEPNPEAVHAGVSHTLARWNDFGHITEFHPIPPLDFEQIADAIEASL